MPTNKSFEQVRQLLTTTSRGEVQSTIQNCVTVLQNDPLFAGGIRLNLLTERVDVTKAMGWSRSGSALTDTDFQYILRRMEQYGLTSDKKVRSALSIAANENRYHPIRDWLNGLVWDGRPRMRQALHHFLGAAESDYTEEALRLFLLGAKPGVAEEAGRRILEQFPNIVLCGTQDGYFKDEEQVLVKVADARPDLLFVCLGAPKQEKWMARWSTHTGARLAIGRGGVLDEFAGKAQRAPEAWQKLGL